MGLSHISAQKVVNNLSESDLKQIIKILGEEKKKHQQLQKYC